MSGTWKATKALPILAMMAGLCLAATAQEPNPTAVAPGATHGDVVAEGPNGTYIYHVKVVARELDAVNYLNRSGATHIGFRGTSLLASAHGDAKVESVTGKSKISAHFEGLTPANGFGPEYLTYVLWAISADGRPQNLGELELSGDKANLDVSSSFQSFGMIVTAEPYYSVSEPSDVVVLVNVHYNLLPRGLYAPTDGAHSVWNPVNDREHVPLALYEAHNAARIAQAAGADKYAADIMAEVATDLKNADDMQSNPHRDVHMLFTYARQATQRAEDARIVTLRKEAAEREQNDRDAKNAAQQQAAQSQAEAANANAAADAAAAAKAQADAARARAESDAARAREQAEEAKRNAAKSEADAAATRENQRERSRPDREHERCAVRHREVHSEAGNAG